MPLKTNAELRAEIDARLPTNNAGAIDAATLRAVLDDIVDLIGSSFYKYLSTDSSVSAGDIVYADTIAGTLTISLPTTATVNQGISIRDASGTWGTQQPYP